MSFIWSALGISDEKYKLSKYKVGVFQTSLKHEEDRDKLWHHPPNTATTTVSGVYYMQLPDDVKDLDKAGTELASLT